MQPLSNRPLTPSELTLVRWMLQNGEPEAQSFLYQVDLIDVSPFKCSCGCASLHFHQPGMPSDTALPGMHVLADFQIGPPDSTCGAFIYSCGEFLAGIEVWNADGQAPKQLPTPADLIAI